MIHLPLALVVQVAPVAPQAEGRLYRDLFGVCIANAGDIDADGVPDLWIGDPSLRTLEDSTGGCVWVVSGKTGKTLRRVPCPESAAEFGWQVCNIGDVDGDGVPDIAVSAEFAPTKDVPSRRFAFDGTSPIGMSSVHAFSGKTGALLRSWSGPADCNKIPWYTAGAGPSLAAVGDWDRDGAGDFAIGWSYADSPDHKTTDCGRVDVVSGKNGSVVHSWAGIESHDRFGFSVTPLGDVDGDGLGDLAASAIPDYAGVVEGAHPNLGRIRPGYVLVLSSKGSVIRRLASPESSRRFGFTTTHLTGSRDGPDLMVSQCHFDEIGPPCLWLFSCATGKRLGRIDRPEEAAWNGDRRGKKETPQPSPMEVSFGSRCLEVRDFDGDGLADLLVTMPQSFCEVPATVLSRRTGAVLARVDLSWQSFGWSHVGNSVSDTGDVDGDGIPDFAVGGASVRFGGGEGAVLICSGKDARILRTVLRTGMDR